MAPGFGLDPPAAAIAHRGEQGGVGDEPGAIRPRVQVIDTYASRSPAWRTQPCRIASISARLQPGSSRSRVMLAANRSRWLSSR